MRIGIPKEIRSAEKRVAALPRTVAKYIDMGIEVAVESSAGEGVFISDDEYEFAGAKIVPDAESLFGESDIILKVNKPLFNDQMQKHEVNMVKNCSIFISNLHLTLPENYEIIRQFQNKNITAISVNEIAETTGSKKMNIQTSMNIITGYKAVIMASDLLPRFIPMVITSTGVLGPAKVLVIGTGKVGLQAVTTALQLGGLVKALDINESARRNAENHGADCIQFYCPEEFASQKEGHAKSIDGEWLEIEQRIIKPYLEEADIVVLSACIDGDVAPILVTEQMISTMKPGSVIMDISVDRGGNCEVTVPDQIIQRLGVYVSGISNIPGMMAMDGSTIYSENIFNFVKHLFKKGIGKIDQNDPIVKNCLVTHSGQIWNRLLLNSFALEEDSRDMDVLVNQ